MLLGPFHVFVLLVKLIVLFNAQPRTYCEVLPTDICTFKSLDQSHHYEASRVVIPMQAGREGINLQNSLATLHSQNLFDNNPRNGTWSLKFYVDIKPKSLEIILNEDMEYLELYHLANDTFFFVYPIYKGDTSDSIVHIIDYPKEDIIFKPTTDESDWVELVGMKVSNKKKRETTSDIHYWKMIGLEYSKYPDREGHLKVYIDGKLSVNDPVQKGEYIRIVDPLYIYNFVFSCIQYHKEPMGDDYFKDFNLNECKTKYKGEPEEKFLECENSR